jgi:4-oxalocrotonate tautomerase
MPHVVVKLYEGRSDQQKIRLAGQMVKDVTATLSCGEDSVSVAIEDIKPDDWTEKVYNARWARRGTYGHQESWLAAFNQRTVRVVHWHGAY